jgi:hypothetical protein
MVLPKKYTTAHFCQTACRLKVVKTRNVPPGEKNHKMADFYVPKIKHSGVQKPIKRSVVEERVNKKVFLSDRQLRKDLMFLYFKNLGHGCKTLHNRASYKKHHRCKKPSSLVTDLDMTNKGFKELTQRQVVEKMVNAKEKYSS